MKPYCLLLLAGLLPSRAHGPAKKATPLCRPGEVNLCSFATTSGKTVSLCRGAGDKYLVYRYGTPTKIELQYPAVLDASSWGKFTFHTYLRGWSHGDTGMDENELSFANGRVRYTVYANRYENGKTDDVKLGVGVRLANGKEVFIKGNWDSQTGSLIDLRDYEQVKTDDGR